MKRESGKVFVLGLDGATFDIIDALIAKGRLPNLEKLIQQGCGRELLSTIHPFSAQAWSSFMTGMNPGKHGIVDFTEHVKGEYKLKFLNASHRRGKSLWRILSDHGKRVGVLNVPFTYPPEEVNGFMISGMDAPSTDSDYTYPKELSEEISTQVGEYIIAGSLPQRNRKCL
jgi:predicted AlkP superfamily phosphohydrolase/phosphomutase